MTAGDDTAHWTGAADDWIAWSRAPGHDAFWSYREALGAFVGRGVGEAIDVGCGEGRVSRLLKGAGWRVVAVDPVEAMVVAAEAERSADAYAVAPASDLPFADHSFDLALAYNVLMDIEDMPAALREIARVLRPDGTLVVSIVHPFIDRGRFDGDGRRFVVEETYFGPARFEAVEERDGLRMRFAGWSRPLGTYAAAIMDAGFVITGVSEPLPDLDVGGGRMERWTRLPLFLWLKARRTA